MAQTSATLRRRATRQMRPARVLKASRSFQNAMTGLVLASAFAPLGALKRKSAKPRKAAAQKAGRVVVPPIPLGAQYLTRRHRTVWGSRAYRLYLPASQPKRLKGLILMLHGCDQTPDDFSIGTHMNMLAEKHGLAIAYPAQTKLHNAAACWSWFKPGDQGRGAGEPAMLASLMRKLTKQLGVRRDLTFVAGLSAGGAMAAILADEYPDIFAGAGIHSGLARGAAHDVMSAMSAMRRGGASAVTPPALHSGAGPVRRIVFHGDKDSTIAPTNAAIIVAAAVGEDTVPTKVITRSVRGRDYTRSLYAGTDAAGPVELWIIKGAGHAWSGGRRAGSYTDSKGPDASAQMVRFFLDKRA